MHQFVPGRVLTAFLVLAGGATAGLVAGAYDAGEATFPLGLVAAVVGCLLVGEVLWRERVRSRAVWNRAGIVSVTAFRSTAHRWSDISSVTPDLFGIRIRVSGRAVLIPFDHNALLAATSSTYRGRLDAARLSVVEHWEEHRFDRDAELPLSPVLHSWGLHAQCLAVGLVAYSVGYAFIPG